LEASEARKKIACNDASRVASMRENDDNVPL
jgi:hypothetical protein